MKSVEPLYFFMHIPKTAGTSFRSMLWRVFDQSVIIPNQKQIEQNNGNYPSIETLKEITKEECQLPKLISGHYPFSTPKILGIESRKVFRITFFRDPIKRCLSHLAHYRRYPSYQNYTAQEIIEKHPLEFRNVHSRYLSDFRTDLSDKELQKAAEERIKQIDFIGLTDAYHFSLIKFEKLTGISLGKEMVANVTKKNHSEKITIETYKLLQELNSIDLYLWKGLIKNI